MRAEAHPLPEAVRHALAQAPLPCFVYDTPAIVRRADAAASLLDRCFFPIKACPEPQIIRALTGRGWGLDLCSPGDVDLALACGTPGTKWKFTSVVLEEALLPRLLANHARLDADSTDQALRWIAAGGVECGLRLRAPEPKALYREKFGIPAAELAHALEQITKAGGRLTGLHVHDQNSNLTPPDYARRLLMAFEPAGALLKQGDYVNLGGSWPMRHETPAPVEELSAAIGEVRQGLARMGFRGAVWAEPGRWITGPCGYWAARVSAVKTVPDRAERRVVLLETSTPIPCRPALTPFLVLRHNELLREPRSLICDLYGAANTALDTLGLEVRLPRVQPGDVVVSCGQGAYTRSLIPPFNERPRPGVVIVPGGSESP
jgi:diaminopimelate decarboxylase/aspartate kinase